MTRNRGACSLSEEQQEGAVVTDMRQGRLPTGGVCTSSFSVTNSGTGSEDTVALKRLSTMEPVCRKRTKESLLAYRLRQR